ncbi:MAG: hypothetical protein R2942_19910 [Ignavibacteria bacterium]
MDSLQAIKFLTTNRGLSWSNISGNLPMFLVGGLVPHRLLNNYLYLGMETGCFRIRTMQE